MLENKASVQFALLPWASVVRPSIGLSLLKSRLREAGIGSTVRYANLRFVSEIGFEAFGLVQRADPALFLGDWLFGEAAFPGWKTDIPGKAQPALPGSFACLLYTSPSPRD